MKKLNSILPHPIPIYFQLVHALGLFMGALALSFCATKIFPSLEIYKEIILLIIWIFLIILTSMVAIKSWRKGFWIITAILLLSYLLRFIL